MPAHDPLRDEQTLLRELFDSPPLGPPLAHAEVGIQLVQRRTVMNGHLAAVGLGRHALRPRELVSVPGPVRDAYADILDVATDLAYGGERSRSQRITGLLARIASAERVHAVRLRRDLESITRAVDDLALELRTPTTLWLTPSHLATFGCRSYGRDGYGFVPRGGRWAVTLETSPDVADLSGGAVTEVVLIDPDSVTYSTSLPLGTYSRTSQILEAVQAADESVQEALSRNL